MLTYSEKKAEIQKWINPQSALLFPDSKVAVFFTPKAAASSVLNWYHNLKGLDKFANDTRTKFGAGKFQLMSAYQNSVLYLDALQDLKESMLAKDGGDWTTIKVVRNPYDRAVSAFLMVLFLRNSEISFREFLALPKSYFTRFGDAHSRLQYSPLERLGVWKPDHVFQIERGLEEVFNDIEHRFLGIGHEKTFNSFANKMNYAPETETGVLTSQQVFASEHLKAGGAVPPRKAFLDSETRAVVHAIYQDDFEAYGYDPALSDMDRPSSFPVTERTQSFYRDEKTFQLYSLIKETCQDKKVAIWGLGSSTFQLIFDGLLKPEQILVIYETDPAIIERWQYVIGYNLKIDIKPAADLEDDGFEKILIFEKDYKKALVRLEALGVDVSRVISRDSIEEFHPINMG